LSAATVGTDVTVEDLNPSPSEEASDGNSEAAPDAVDASEQAEASTGQASSARKLGRNIRKSEMPPLNEEDLVPGASFTGKVMSIKPFGVFVDIGAFTEGLVHISRVSDGFVKDISSLFTVGQEVSVRLLEANKETKRISLTMREGDDYVKPQKETPKAANGGRSATATPKSSPRQTRERQELKETLESKYVPGQSLNGTVKSTTRAGTFVTLPDGSEGFLPREEEALALFTLIGQSAMEIGKQIRVKVLNVAQGQATLTMKGVEDDEDDLKTLNMELKRDWSRGTNAFELAFRRNKEISAFLDQRERTKVPADTSVSAPEAESYQEEAAPEDEESSEELSSVSEVATDVSPPVSDASSQVGIQDSTSVANAAEDQTVGSESSPTISVELSSNGTPDSSIVSSVSETADKPTEPEESSAVEEVLVTASSEAGKEPAADTEAVPALSEKTGAEVAAAAGVAQASTTTGL
jgi:elongation factor Ts